MDTNKKIFRLRIKCNLEKSGVERTLNRDHENVHPRIV